MKATTVNLLMCGFFDLELLYRDVFIHCALDLGLDASGLADMTQCWKSINTKDEKCLWYFGLGWLSASTQRIISKEELALCRGLQSSLSRNSKYLRTSVMDLIEKAKRQEHRSYLVGPAGMSQSIEWLYEYLCERNLIQGRVLCSDGNLPEFLQSAEVSAVLQGDADKLNVVTDYKLNISLPVFENIEICNIVV